LEARVDEAKVVLGVEDRALQEEVLHFLERLPRISVVRAVADPETFPRAIRDSQPDAVVVSPTIIRARPDVNGASILVVAQRETTEGLRAAIRHGARGFYLWPEERQALARDTERSGLRPEPQLSTPGKVVAVYGARGGSGTTFLATNLAAALAGRGTSSVLVDFDTFYGDVTGALGIGANGGSQTVADLVPVADELTGEHLDRVLYEHPRGFHVLKAPEEPGDWDSVKASHLTEAVRVLRGRFESVVLHVPRGMSPITLAGLEAADEILLLVTLDVLAFRDAKRLLSFLASRGMDGRCRLVVNRATRAEVVPDDAERVFGLRSSAVLRTDRSVVRAQNRGELVAGRSGHTARRITALADLVVPKESA
jgi:pilus assembly protein CpaE